MGAPKNFNEVLNFEEHYARFMLPLLDRIEKERIRALLVCLPLDIICGFVILCISFPPVGDIIGLYKLSDGVIFSFFLIAAALSSISYSARSKYKKNAKEKLFNILFSFLGNFKYQKEQNLRITDFNCVDFIPSYDRNYVDDYIKGTYKNLNIDFEELCLKRRYRDSKGRTRYVTVFEGLLVKVPQLKQTSARITIRNKKYGQAVNKNQEVLLEDVEFNKLYEVSATDQVEARYILTPIFMEKLKNLHRKNICVVISLQDGEIIMSMKKNKDLFEPPYWTTAKNINAYREILSQVSEVLKIIDTLQLSIKPKL